VNEIRNKGKKSFNGGKSLIESQRDGSDDHNLTGTKALDKKRKQRGRHMDMEHM